MTHCVLIAQESDEEDAAIEHQLEMQALADARGEGSSAYTRKIPEIVNDVRRVLCCCDVQWLLCVHVVGVSDGCSMRL